MKLIIMQISSDFMESQNGKQIFIGYRVRSLQSHLKENFNKLKWDDKYIQFANAVKCLYNEKIIHCDLVI